MYGSYGSGSTTLRRTFRYLKIWWQDIKRALFECQSPEESECGSPKKKKRDPRRILSTSAPPSISGNNLLGKHPFSKVKSSIFQEPWVHISTVISSVNIPAFGD